MYQLNGERAELYYASMDAGDSTAFMRLASASSVVGAERLRDRDFFGFSLAVTASQGEHWARAAVEIAVFLLYSLRAGPRGAQLPLLRDLKNQSKLNCRALRISTRMRSQFPRRTCASCSAKPRVEIFHQ